MLETMIPHRESVGERDGDVTRCPATHRRKTVSIRDDATLPTVLQVVANRPRLVVRLTRHETRHQPPRRLMDSTTTGGNHWRWTRAVSSAIGKEAG
jgi:hypothetical protein